jgi:hypothetical protein
MGSMCIFSVKMEAAALTQSTSRFPESRRPQERTTMGVGEGVSSSFEEPKQDESE